MFAGPWLLHVLIIVVVVVVVVVDIATVVYYDECRHGGEGDPVRGRRWIVRRRTTPGPL